MQFDQVAERPAPLIFKQMEAMGIHAIRLSSMRSPEVNAWLDRWVLTNLEVASFFEVPEATSAHQDQSVRRKQPARKWRMQQQSIGKNMARTPVLSVADAKTTAIWHLSVTSIDASDFR